MDNKEILLLQNEALFKYPRHLLNQKFFKISTHFETTGGVGVRSPIKGYKILKSASYNH
jgi:hypothetical protein